MSLIVRISIHLSGIVVMVFSGSLLCTILINLDIVQESPLLYYFSLWFGPPLLLLGWRILARRFWAGVALEAVLTFFMYDWMTAIRSKNRFEDLVMAFMFLFLLFSLVLYHDEWIKKI